MTLKCFFFFINYLKYTLSTLSEPHALLMNQFFSAQPVRCDAGLVNSVVHLDRISSQVVGNCPNDDGTVYSEPRDELMN